MRVGLTGSIGSGKSTVAHILRQWGMVVLDADAVAKEVSETPETLAEIKDKLGAQYVTASGLNRPELARLVFGQPEKRAILNSIIHPKVRNRMAELEQEATGDIVFQDIPLLFESGLEVNMDSVMVVDAPWELRLSRVQHRSNLSPEEVQQRDRSQMPPEIKRQKSNFVIENSGTLLALREQVLAVVFCLKTRV